LLRVLTLPEQVQEMVQKGELSSGHAKALLALAAQHSVVGLAKEAASLGMSVRALEQRVRELNTPQAAATADGGMRSETQRAAQPVADPAVRRIEDQLRTYLQTDVRLRLSDQERGVIELTFYSNDDLDRVLDLILRESRRDF
jgi:ParB family chromosome partitioning protein